MASKLYSLFSKTEQQRSSCKQQRGGFPTTLINDDRVFEDGFRPLSAVADAFEELSSLLKAKDFDHDLDLKTFCRACSLVSVLFGCLGIAFKFAELEYCSKVNDLQTASESFKTLNSLLKFDVQNETVKTPGSLSRNLRRVRQGLDLIRALLINFLSSEECSLKDAATTAYADTCAGFHTWTVRTAVYAGMYALPTRDQLLLNLNETGKSSEREMRRYINASQPVIQYIDSLYTSRGISLDW